MMVRISFDRSAVETAKSHCLAEYPNEACGLLIGSKDLIVSTIPAVNVWPDAGGRAKRFTIDPQQQLQVERSLDGTGRQVVGTYHSHPDHPAVPSAFDLESAWPVYIYVIVNVVKYRVDDVRAWKLSDAGDSFVEVPIDVVS